MQQYCFVAAPQAVDGVWCAEDGVPLGPLQHLPRLPPIGVHECNSLFWWEDGRERQVFLSKGI